jgi:hypothetical protein
LDPVPKMTELPKLALPPWAEPLEDVEAEFDPELTVDPVDPIKQVVPVIT